MSSHVFHRATPVKSRELLDEHREVLCTDSAILPGLVTERGYYSLPRKSIEYLITKKVFDNRLRSGTSWLGIPIYRPDGKHHGDIIRIFGTDIQTKYLWPYNIRQAADIHPIGREEWLLDLDVPIVMTEGIRKGDSILSAAIQEDIPCLVISLNGCWGWKTRMEKRASITLPDFQDVPLENRKIYIVSDSDFRTNDDVQRGWSEAVTYFGSKSGKKTATQLIIVPPRGLAKQGADDFLANGGTLADLLALASTPSYTRISTESVIPRAVMYQTGRQIIATAKDRVPHIMEPLIAERSINLVAGHSGTYKSWHCLSLALDGAFGLTWTDHPNIRRIGDPFTTIYVNKEMGSHMMGTRLKQLALSPRYKDHPEFSEAVEKRLVIVGEGESEIDMNLEAQRQRLEDLIVQMGAKLVILDSLSMSWSGNENDSTEVGNLYRLLRGISDRTGVSWILVHHLLKPQQERRRNLPNKHLVRGSGQLVQQADSVMLYDVFEPDEPRNDVKFTAVVHSKGRSMGEMSAWLTKFTDHDGFYITLEYSSQLSEARASSYAKSHGDPKKLGAWMAVALSEITAIQPSGSGIRSKELIRLLQVAWPTKQGRSPSDSTLRRHLDRMTESGELSVIDRNQKLGDLYMLPEIVPEIDNMEDHEE